MAGCSVAYRMGHRRQPLHVPNAGRRDLSREKGGGIVNLHIDNRDGVWNIDYERRPMSKRRFRAVCALIAAALYACIAIGITALCGLAGAGVVAGTTFLCALVSGLETDVRR